ALLRRTRHGLVPRPRQGNRLVGGPDSGALRSRARGTAGPGQDLAGPRRGAPPLAAARWPYSSRGAGRRPLAVPRGGPEPRPGCVCLRLSCGGLLVAARHGPAHTRGQEAERSVGAASLEPTGPPYAARRGL